MSFYPNHLSGRELLRRGLPLSLQLTSSKQCDPSKDSCHLSPSDWQSFWSIYSNPSVQRDLKNIGEELENKLRTERTFCNDSRAKQMDGHVTVRRTVRVSIKSSMETNDDTRGDESPVAMHIASFTPLDNMENTASMSNHSVTTPIDSPTQQQDTHQTLPSQLFHLAASSCGALSDLRLGFQHVELTFTTEESAQLFFELVQSLGIPQQQVPVCVILLPTINLVSSSQSTSLVLVPLSFTHTQKSRPLVIKGLTSEALETLCARVTDNPVHVTSVKETRLNSSFGLLGNTPLKRMRSSSEPSDSSEETVKGFILHVKGSEHPLAAHLIQHVLIWPLWYRFGVWLTMAETIEDALNICC